MHASCTMQLFSLEGARGIEENAADTSSRELLISLAKLARIWSLDLMVAVAGGACENEGV